MISKQNYERSENSNYYFSYIGFTNMLRTYTTCTCMYNYSTITQTKHGCIDIVKLKNDCYSPIQHSILTNKLTIWLVQFTMYMYSAGIINHNMNM